MDAPDHPNHRPHRVKASERTLRVLEAVLDHPGQTVKQLTRLLNEAGEAFPEQTVRDHLGGLVRRGWVHRAPGGSHMPGPKAAAGRHAVAQFQTLLDILRSAPHGLTVTELAGAAGIAEQSVRSGIEVGKEFDCVRFAGGRYRLNPDGLPLPLCTASDEDLDAVLKEFVGETEHDAALVHLSQIDGLVLSHLHQAPGKASLLAGVGPDAAHGTAGGQAALSWLDDDQRDRYLGAHGMREFTSLTPTTVEALNALWVREPGHIYAAEGQYCTVGSCLAILVHNGPATGDRIALTTSVWRKDLKHDRAFLENHLYRAAAQLIPILDGPLPAPPADQS
ncbi:hypothetical protein GCM10029992_36200 [Glycomyces albus]